MCTSRSPVLWGWGLCVRVGHLFYWEWRGMCTSRSPVLWRWGVIGKSRSPVLLGMEGYVYE